MPFHEGAQIHTNRAPALPGPHEREGLPPDGGPRYNRLIFEESPYLLQHATNPVNWYSWGEEAFERARREEKPIFLSIGYSTCHWCHVMERESFEDPEVAALLNRSFVSIKVDREERPDIDKVYMDVTQALTGRGGWPMTVVMTPEKRPFLAGTYFPKEGRMGVPGLMELLPHLAGLWQRERERITDLAGRIEETLQGMNRSFKGRSPGEDALTRAQRALARIHDPLRGGFGEAPKFPSPPNLLFLLRRGDQEALEMVDRTLHAMARGGIHDHLGFGFHRYSTDREWLVPHFEKMLYDQALLALTYVEAYQATGQETHGEVARKILTYVLRDLASPEGGFHSAEDADSEGEEGLFYLWTTAEIRSILGPRVASLFEEVFNVDSQGNYLDESTRARTGRNILHQARGLDEVARDHHLTRPELDEILEDARARLFTAREMRIHPYKDDKILTGWNGLALAALAKAARSLEEPSFEEAARRCARFILTHLRSDEGRLLKRYRNGEAGLPAHLEDYAFLVWGLIELYETTFEEEYLREALALNDIMVKHFWDPEEGGLFLSADDGEALLVRPKEIFDGATPSGNSVAAMNLLRLARLTGRSELESRATAILEAFSGLISDSPTVAPFALMALDFMVGPAHEVVLSGKRGQEDLEGLIRALRRPFLPRAVVLLHDENGGRTALEELAPFVVNMTSIRGAATAYVCQSFTCTLPTNDAREMLASLGQEMSS